MRVCMCVCVCKCVCVCWTAMKTQGRNRVQERPGMFGQVGMCVCVCACASSGSLKEKTPNVCSPLHMKVLRGEDVYKQGYD